MSFSRRSFLRGAGGLMLALPWLEVMQPAKAYGAPGDGQPKRFCTWWVANGSPSNGANTMNWNCTGTGTRDLGNGVQEIQNFAMSPILTPLERHRAGLLILQDLRMCNSNYAHDNATVPQLTGRDHTLGNGGISTATGASLDQTIAQAYGNRTKLASIHLGVQVGAEQTNASATISYLGQNQPVRPQNSPYAAFNSLFTGLPSSTPNPMADALLARIRMKKQSVLDSVLSNANTFQKKLGKDDRTRLDQHMTAVRDLESRLNVATAPGGMCTAPNLGQQIDINANDNVPMLGSLHMDIMVMAFACDLTRVATFQWDSTASERLHTWIPGAGSAGWHSISHNDQATLGKINTWYNTQLAIFLDRLKAIPEGAGTLFDNTVVFATNEYGWDHRMEQVPVVLAGSCGGYFKTGRYIKYPFNAATRSGGMYHNGVLAAIQNAMGVPGGFGSTNYGTTAYAELSNV